MKQKICTLLALGSIIALVTTACSISALQNPVDRMSTSVAGTVAALAENAGISLTLTPPVVETAVPPTEVLSNIEAPLQVSFVSPDHNLYTWNENLSTAQQLTSSGDVAESYISPDGSLIAFTRFTEYTITSLNVISSDGTGERTLLDKAGFAALPKLDYAITSQPYQLAWIPGTHKLAMNTRMELLGPGLATGKDLFIFDIDNGTMSTLLTISEDWSYTFHYSPDGSKIAISYPTGIDVYNSDGSLLAASVLEYDFVNTASEYAWTASPVWSQDNTLLVAAVAPAQPFSYSGEDVQDTTIWRMNADGSETKLMGGVKNYFSAVTSIAFSPDLSQMLYYTIQSDNTFRLHIANIDGTNAMEYATGEFHFTPLWSTDNSHFIYAVGNDLADTVYIGQVGGLPTTATDFSNALNVKWIDTNRFVVSSNQSGRWYLLLGEVGSPSGVIYDSVTEYAIGTAFLTFSVNR